MPAKRTLARKTIPLSKSKPLFVRKQPVFKDERRGKEQITIQFVDHRDAKGNINVGVIPLVVGGDIYRRGRRPSDWQSARNIIRKAGFSFKKRSLQGSVWYDVYDNQGRKLARDQIVALQQRLFPKKK